MQSNTYLNSPCKECPDRKIGCHSKCEKYLKYRAKYDEINNKVRMYKLHGSERSSAIIGLAEGHDRMISMKSLSYIDREFKTKYDNKSLRRKKKKG